MQKENYACFGCIKDANNMYYYYYFFKINKYSHNGKILYVKNFRLLVKLSFLFKLDIVHILYSHYEDGELGRQYAKFYAKIKKNLMVLNVIYLFFIFILG